MLRRFTAISIIISMVVVCVRPQAIQSLPHYQPTQKISGVIRAWGDDQMKTLMSHWQDGFRKFHPEVRFDTKLIGTGTGMAGLYTGVADLALMGRESTAKEVQAFEWVFKYKPLPIEVVTGSLNVPGKSFALTVFVHKDNPLARLTLAQLDGIFGSEHLRGSSNIRTWGDLGLTGEWKDKPITPYGYDAQTGTAAFFRRATLNGSDKWNCDLKEFADAKEPDNSPRDASQSVLEALAHDRFGIAYGNARHANAQLKPVAIAATDQTPAYLATKHDLVARRYPLTRATFIYINRTPNAPLEPKVRELLRYILSREGQQEVVREGDFLPLSEQAIAEQLRKLE